MRVTQCVNELSNLQACNVSAHVSEERIRRDVNLYADKAVSASLIQQAGQLPFGDVELEQAVARREPHLVDLGHIPSTDHESPGIRVTPDFVDHPLNLVDRLVLFQRWPLPPLHSVYRS